MWRCCCQPVRCDNISACHQRLASQTTPCANTHTHACIVTDTARKRRFGINGFPSVLRHCRLGDRKGIRPVKSWVLVCWWRRFDRSFARVVAPVVTTTSIILSCNRNLDRDILVPTNLGPPVKWPLKRTERVKSIADGADPLLAFRDGEG